MQIETFLQSRTIIDIDTRFEIFESFAYDRVELRSFTVPVTQKPFYVILLRSFMILFPVRERSLPASNKELCPFPRFPEQSNSKVPFTVFHDNSIISISVSSFPYMMAAPQFTPFAEVYSHPHGRVHKAIAGIIPYKSGLTPLFFLFHTEGAAADVRHVQRLEDYQILHLKGRIASSRYTNC
jgi:hypothetical protein